MGEKGKREDVIKTDIEQASCTFPKKMRGESRSQGCREGRVAQERKLCCIEKLQRYSLYTAEPILGSIAF